jgi:hypothetical protein
VQQLTPCELTYFTPHACGREPSHGTDIGNVLFQRAFERRGTTGECYQMCWPSAAARILFLFGALGPANEYPAACGIEDQDPASTFTPSY